MPPSTQKKQSKLFQCSGYGDCKMVFTRGEHLARHERKHTGEKPFPCIVPDCNKSFSRFDNMMQHTQTHRKDTQQSKLQQSRSYQQQYQHQSTIAKPIQSPEQSNKVILHQPLLTINTSSAPHQPQYTTNSSMHEGHVGSESPASLASASAMDYASSSDDDDDDDDDENCHYYHHHNGHAHWIDHPYRQLSVADMCNPMVAQQPLKIEQLTSDEVEAIQAFGKLRQSTC